MNKRRILAAAMALCIVAIIAVGATLAYFTDKDAKTNTFTVGKVDITLKEDFDKDNAKLLPGSVSSNAVKKEVKIKVEDDSEDAYVWYEWLIPAELDDANASKNIVHVNSAGSTWDKYRENKAYWADDQTEALPIEKTWDHTTVGDDGLIGQETIDGIVYNKYAVLYHGIVKAGEETTIAMKQVYLDSKVDVNEKGEYTINGKVINYDFTKGVDIIVRAYGIQADGFATVYDAYKAYKAQTA